MAVPSPASGSISSPPFVPPKVPGEIVREIRKLHRHRAPMNLSAMKRRRPELLAKVYSLKKFVGWKNALAAAGISYDEINVELLDYVTCPICQKDFGSLASHLTRVHETGVQEVREDYPDLTTFSEEQFAGMFARVEKIPPLPHWEPLWTGEYVLDRIAEYHARGLPLYATGVEPGLAACGRRHFGTWMNALRAVGLDPNDHVIVRQDLYRQPEAVLAGIRDRLDAGLPLDPQAFRQGRYRDPTLYANGLKHFGSWRAALTAAELDPEDHSKARSRYWKPESVLAEIRRRHAEALPLSANEVGRGPHRDISLYRKGQEHFGTWREAIRVALAGVELNSEVKRLLNWDRYRDPGAVLAEIRRRHTEGLPLNTHHLQTTGQPGDRPLYNKGVRFFGTWPLALEKAGVNPAQVMRSGRFSVGGQGKEGNEEEESG